MPATGDFHTVLNLGVAFREKAPFDISGDGMMISDIAYDLFTVFNALPPSFHLPQMYKIALIPADCRHLLFDLDSLDRSERINGVLFLHQPWRHHAGVDQCA